MTPETEPLHLKVDRMGRNGEGVAVLPDGRVAFIGGALPGEIVEARISEQHARYARGQAVAVLDRSPERRLPPCPVYWDCGGCTFQHWSYEAEGAYKVDRVREALARIGGVEAHVAPLRAPQYPYRYRTKASFPWTGTPGQAALGLYGRKSHQVVATDRCLIQDPMLDDLLSAAVLAANALKLEPYDEVGGRGVLRHLVLRASHTDHRTVVLVVVTRRDPRLKVWAERLMAAVDHLQGVALSVQRERTNKILGGPAETLAGRPVLHEQLAGMVFEVGADVFFQVNPGQMESLLDVMTEEVGPGRGRLALDLYAGVGVLGLLMARAGYRVTAVESSSRAVASGRASARDNGLAIDFRTGAVEEVLPALIEGGYRPDLVVLDPPRSGVRPVVAATLLDAAPSRIIYVSCDPETLARDVALWQSLYEVRTVAPVDLFPRTDHVETVLTLVRR